MVVQTFGDVFSAAADCNLVVCKPRGLGFEETCRFVTRIVDLSQMESN